MFLHTMYEDTQHWKTLNTVTLLAPELPVHPFFSFFLFNSIVLYVHFNGRLH